MLEEIHPFDFATELGWNKYLHIGKLALPELQMSYSLAALQRPNYDDTPRARLRRHTLLYWEAGFFKTSLITEFMEKLTPAWDVAREPNFIAERCSYLNFSSDITVERARGGAEGKTLILPIINRPHFLCAGELLRTIGTSRDERERNVHFLNEVLEEGIGRVALVKMTNTEPTEEQEAEMNLRGIVLNKDEALMTYPVKGTFLGASHILPDSTMHQLRESGFLSRQHVVRWKHSEPTFREQWDWTPPPCPEAEMLRRYNSQLWRVQIDKVNYPPIKMIDEAKGVLKEEYLTLEDLHKLPYTSLMDMRDTTTLASALTASASIQIHHRDGASYSHDELHYDSEDLDFAITYARQIARNKLEAFKQVGRTSAKDRKEWAAYKALRSVHTDEEMTLKDFRGAVMAVLGVQQRAAELAIEKWVDAGFIEKAQMRGHPGNRKKVIFLK